MKNLPFAFDEGKCANVGNDSVMLCGKTKSCHLFDGDNFHIIQRGKVSEIHLTQTNVLVTHIEDEICW